MIRIALGAITAALLLLPGCGRADDTPGQPSADERQKLDDIARKRDEEQGTFDTSPDSLVPADEGAGRGNAVAPAMPPASNAANMATPR